MGKDSLIKSTTKKKAPAKKAPAKDATAKKKKTAKAKTAIKKTATKKPVAKKPAPKKVAPQKTAPKKIAKKAAPVKAKKTTAPKPKAPAKKKTPVKAKTPARKPTLNELLKRQFDRPKQPTLFTPPKVASMVADAPPISTSARIKALLLKPQGLAAATPTPNTEPVTPAAAPTVKAAPAPTPQPASSIPPPPAAPGIPADNGGRKLMTRVIIAVAVAFLMILAASKMNAAKFYLEDKDGALVVYQGNFAPKGRHLLMTLPGVGLPTEDTEIYRQTAVYPIIYAYFIQRADNLLSAPGLPDFDGIKAYLNKAKKFAVGSDMTEDLHRRTNGIDLLINLYKAEVAASRNTTDSITDALAYLEAARRLDPDPAQEKLITQKAEEFQVQQAALDAAAAKAEEEKAKED